jgi:hypothetical protein
MINTKDKIFGLEKRNIKKKLIAIGRTIYNIIYIKASCLSAAGV